MSIHEEGTRRFTGMSQSSVRHVLGVAFPYADIAAAREVDLERCFLRLAYAVSRLSSSGESVRGYFAVLSQEARDAVRRLRARYGVSDSVHIVFASLLVADMTRLADATEAVARDGNPAVLATVGREIASDALRREIALLEPGVVEKPAECGPFEVCWDFCGVVSVVESASTAADTLNPRLL